MSSNKTLFRKLCISILAGMFFFTNSFLANALEEKFIQFGIQGGTLGVGITGGVDFSQNLAARGFINYFPFDYGGIEVSNIEYDLKLNLQSLGLMLDLHPFGSSFRITGGVLINNNDFSLKAQSDDLEIGQRDYKGELNVKTDFGKLAPYASFGWASNRRNEGLGFFLDIGTFFQGTAKLPASGEVQELTTGNQCNFSISESGVANVNSGCLIRDSLKSDLEEEHKSIRDKADDLRYKFYPVVSIGVLYRF